MLKHFETNTLEDFFFKYWIDHIMVNTEIFKWNLMTFPWPFKGLFKQ